MRSLSLIALALHVLGVSLWLGGALSLTRVAAAADEQRDPQARAALVALSKKLLRAVCVPWMTAAMAGAVALLVLGPARHVRALVETRAFWLELVAGLSLYAMHRALERRVSRVAKQRLPAARAAADRDAPEDDRDGDSPSKNQDEPPYVPTHTAPLRRVQRVMLLLTVIAVVAALSRR
ncbi:MAG: hypothetical protein U0269_10785 [Polyangiales bacterium]